MRLICLHSSPDDRAVISVYDPMAYKTALGCHLLRVCFDQAAPVMAGLNPLSSIDRVIEQIAIIHVRDATEGSDEITGNETALAKGNSTTWGWGPC